MYKLGKPVHRTSVKAWLFIALLMGAVTFGFYFALIIRNDKTEIKNNNAPLITRVGGDSSNSITINEPLFTLQLKGLWKESSRDTDPNYHTIQWNYTGKDSTGRWIRIYVDTIPKDQAFNYLQPVTANQDVLSIGQMSENCATFTQGATPNVSRDVSVPNSQASLSARWQGVTFMCDNSHVSHQLVGTGSTDGNNAVSVTGKEHGKHQYFFLYNDDNYHADYSVFVDTLNTFRAK